MTQSSSMRLSALAVVALLTLGTSGCSTFNEMNKTEQGAIVGAGTGAAVGAVIGAATGSTVAGLLIGAAVGGGAGALIGREMDKQAETLQEDLGESAEVERIGEGIAVTFASGILFDFDSDGLRPEAESNLQELAESLVEYPNTEVHVVGHTDSRGDDDYNLRLSQRRAQAAANYLLAEGITPQRVRTQGVGETEPIADNETEAGRQENRRVEIAIFATEEYREQVQQQVGDER